MIATPVSERAVRHFPYDALDDIFSAAVGHLSDSILGRAWKEGVAVSGFVFDG